MAYFVLKLETIDRKSIFKAKWCGDPGRTFLLENASRYCAPRYAKSALTKIRNMYGRQFKDAKIIRINK